MAILGDATAMAESCARRRSAALQAYATPVGRRGKLEVAGEAGELPDREVEFAGPVPW